MSARYFKALSAMISCFVLPFALALRTTVARAQTQNAPVTNATSSASPTQLEEVVVTATKREATVLRTPISVTAISGQDIQARGYTDFASLIQSVPGVSMQSEGPGQTEIEIRGISSTGGNSPTTGFYFGDTPLTAPSGANDGKVVIDPNLYDLNRIEVLRGPQGTLYGASSMGGTVRLIPNDPNPDYFDASGQAILSGTDGGGVNPTGNAMVNLPLFDGKAALRIVGTEQFTSGWIDRMVVAPGAFPVETNGGKTRGDVLGAPIAKDYKNDNDETLSAARVSLLLKPIEELTITPMVFYQRIAMGMPDYFDSEPGTLARYQPYDIAEPYSDRFSLGSLNVAYKTPWFDVVSNTSYWERESTQVSDGTEVVQALLGEPSFYPPDGLGPLRFTVTDSSHQFSQEVRLASRDKSRFTWIVGGFYSEFQSIAYNMSTEESLVPTFGTSDFFWKGIPTKITQTAAFGEGSYEILPGLRATVGLRKYFYTTKVISSQSGVLGPTGTDAVTTVVTDARNEGINPKYDISYEASENLTAYATASKGFRPGGGNQQTPTTGTEGAACLADLKGLGLSAEPTAFGPDSLWSYELGVKARFLDGKLSINSDVYRENWTGLQQQADLSCGYGFTENAGAAHIYGTEIEARAILTKGLVASVNIGYVHARISKGAPSAGTVSGDYIQDAPDLTSNVGLTYTRPFSANVALVAHIEDTYVSKRYQAGYTSLTSIPAYALTNLRFGIKEQKWEASLFANNVFNRRAYLGIGTDEVGFIPTFSNIATVQPLTIGIDLSYRFH
jgi:iron complex outermembrane receptor protein